MSETEATTIDPAVVPAAIETTENTPAAETTTTETTESRTEEPTKPAGYDPVDLNTAPPEKVKERLDYLYKQIKPLEREKKEMRQILQKQSEIIDQLSQGQQQVVQHLTQQSFADKKVQLNTAMQDAWKKNDNVAYIKAQNELMDLQVEERLQDRLQRQQQAEVKPNGRGPASATEVANQAMQGGELSDDDYRITDSWQNERDASGNLVRPWAYATDPAHQAALYETRSVLANPRYAHLTYEQKLAEVDRRMGTTKQTPGQSVMRGSLTKPAKITKIELTPKQREIALKTQYAGKGKSEADHLEKYRQQIEKFHQKRAK